MIGRVVEVVESDRHLSLEYGSMVVREGHTQIGRVALDDIQSVIINPHGATVSAGILAALAERGIPVVISGPNFRPVATVVPIFGHHAIAHRVEAQVGASQPARKQAWKQIIRSKIAMQAMVLEQTGKDAEYMWRLESEVRSGDPQNCEAQAARYYWPRLLGQGFRRDPDSPGLNALLNYGYGVLRAATARAITAAGLHPSIGVHHRSAHNPMRLADDMMEPFRPMVDMRVWGIAQSDIELDVIPSTKKMLVGVLNTDLPWQEGTSPVSVVIHQSVKDLAEYYMGDRKRLRLPSVAVRPGLEALAEAYL